MTSCQRREGEGYADGWAVDNGFDAYPRSSADPGLSGAKMKIHHPSSPIGRRSANLTGEMGFLAFMTRSSGRGIDRGRIPSDFPAGTCIAPRKGAEKLSLERGDER